MSKTRDTGFLANVIQVHDTGVRIMSGSNMLMAISSSGAVTITGELSGSDAANSLLLSGTGSVGFTTTSSFLAVSSSQQQVSASYISLSGSYNTFSGSASTRITENSSSIQQVSSSQQQISSSLLQVSASYISLSGSYTTFSGSASTRITTISSSQQDISSSQQQISSSLLNVISIFATTGSNSFRANQSITGSLVVSSTITAQTLVVQTVTSSIVYSSGSNIFGCDLNSRQTFTGSVLITGSLTIAGGSSATSYSGTTIYGSTAVCSPVGKFTSCIDAGSGTFSGCVNIFTGNQIRLYNSAKNNWTQIDSPLVSGDAAVDLRITTQTGAVYINHTGVACFNNAICAPRAELTSDASCVPLRLINGVITGGSTTGVTALYFGDAGSGVSMLQREKYAANQANLVLYSEYGYNTQSINACMGYNGVAFYTAGTKRLNIDGSGITCFSSTVCSPQFRANVGGCGCIAFFSANGNIVFDNGSISAIGNMGNNASQFSVSSRGCLTFRVGESGDPSAAPLRFLMDTNGIACFACRVCAPNINLSNGLSINACSTVTVADWYNTNTDNGNGLYIKAGGVNSGKYIMALENAAGCSRMMVLANGSVGIGTNSPVAFDNYTYLHIAGKSTTQGGVLYLSTSDSSKTSEMYVDGNGFSLSSGNNNMRLLTSTIERMRITSTGITCFACAVCTPVLRASRVISNSTQLFDSDFSLNAGVTRSVVLCGGIYTLGDFHLMVYGNAGTGMSTIRLSTAGYFANTSLLQFCELQRYTFGSMTISGVSNNGTSISFNIGNCSGGSNGTGFWRMLSLNGDAENNCINVYVI